MIIVGHIHTVIEIYKGMIPDLPVNGQRSDDQKQTDQQVRSYIEKCFMIDIVCAHMQRPVINIFGHKLSLPEPLKYYSDWFWPRNNPVLFAALF